MAVCACNIFAESDVSIPNLNFSALSPNILAIVVLSSLPKASFIPSNAPPLKNFFNLSEIVNDSNPPLIASANAAPTPRAATPPNVLKKLLSFLRDS